MNRRKLQATEARAAAIRFEYFAPEREQERTFIVQRLEQEREQRILYASRLRALKGTYAKLSLIASQNLFCMSCNIDLFKSRKNSYEQPKLGLIYCESCLSRDIHPGMP